MAFLQSVGCDWNSKPKYTLLERQFCLRLAALRGRIASCRPVFQPAFLRLSSALQAVERAFWPATTAFEPAFALDQR
jgi:hypothetical protein